MCQEHPLKEEMATQSSILTIPWTEKPGGLQSMGPQRVGCTVHVCKHTHTHTHTLPINVCIQKQYSTYFLGFFKIYINGIILYMYCYFILLFSDEKGISVNLL